MIMKAELERLRTAHWCIAHRDGKQCHTTGKRTTITEELAPLHISFQQVPECENGGQKRRKRGALWRKKETASKKLFSCWLADLILLVRAQCAGSIWPGLLL